jgi:hypothetical protein
LSAYNVDAQPAALALRYQGKKDAAASPPIEIRVRGERAIVIHDEFAEARLARLIALAEAAA